MTLVNTLKVQLGLLHNRSRVAFMASEYAAVLVMTSINGDDCARRHKCLTNFPPIAIVRLFHSRLFCKFTQIG